MGVIVLKLSRLGKRVDEKVSELVLKPAISSDDNFNI